MEHSFFYMLLMIGIGISWIIVLYLVFKHPKRCEPRLIELKAKEQC
jgi:hypothetical protein